MSAHLFAECWGGKTLSNRHATKAIYVNGVRGSLTGHVALFSKLLTHTTCPFSPHEGRYTVTFISEQYVPSICPEPAAPKLRELRVSAGMFYFSSVFY